MDLPLYKSKPPKSLDGKYYLYEKIGEGAWAKVRRALDANHNTFACKQYYRCTVDKRLKDGMDRLRTEYELVNSLKHKNIVRYFEMLMDDDKVYVIMEYLANGSVESLIKDRDLNRPTIVGVMKDLLSAISYLHSNSICHHDIKPGNLLISQEGVVKISDFGVAERMEDASHSQSPYGTPAYQAPEVVRGNYPYDGKKADMWSAGVVLYQLLNRGELPWKETSIYLVMREIVDSQDIVNGDGDAADLLRQLLRKDPVTRIDADQALRHPFLLNSHRTCGLM